MKFQFNLQKQHVENLETKAKVILILWALGSGKTHLLNWLLPYTPENTKIIVNDIGSINVDVKRIKSSQTTMLSEWCVCCEDINWLKKALVEAKDSDCIIIEPSGIASGDDIVSLVKRLWFDISIITLQDVTHFNKRTPAERVIMENQIKVANIIWYTWVDENFPSVSKVIETLKPEVPSFIIPKRQEEHISDTNSFQELFQLLSSSTKKTINKSLYTPVCSDTHSSHKNPLTTHSFIKEIENWNFEILQNFLSQNRHIIRAKWVVENISFNYTHGNLEIDGWSEEKNYANFISWEKTLELSKETSFSSFIWLSSLPMIVKSSDFQWKIDTLVAMYHQYMDLEKEIQELKKDTQKNALIINALWVKQKLLWESMKYDNPHIWLEYKIEAYKDSSWAINTIKDLKEHAKSPTYICHKRLQFLAKYMKEKFGKDIFDKDLDQNMLIRDFFAWDDIGASTDEIFVLKWLEYEYFEVNGKVAKWENFTL